MVKISQVIQQVNEKLNVNEVVLNEESILKLYRETMLKIYDFGFEVSAVLLHSSFLIFVMISTTNKKLKEILSFCEMWVAPEADPETKHISESKIFLCEHPPPPPFFSPPASPCDRICLLFMGWGEGGNLAPFYGRGSGEWP